MKLNLNNERFLITEPSLNSWISNLRRSYRKGSLSPKIIEKIEKINGWEWNVGEMRWEKNLRETFQYLEKNNGEFPKARSKLGK